MVSVPTVDRVKEALDEGNQEIDEEIVRRFFGFATMFEKFWKWGLEAHPRSFREEEKFLPLEVESADKEDMDFLLWTFQGQLVGHFLQGYGLRFGLYKGEPIEVHPEKVVIKTYGPDGRPAHYINGTQPKEGPLEIEASCFVDFTNNPKGILLGDRSVMGFFSCENHEYLRLLRSFGKYLQAEAPKDEAGWISYG